MTATFYDRKAERAAASALADQQRAQAEATRAQTALAMVQVEQARNLAAVELADRRAAREQERREAARARRAAARARLAARVPEWLLSALWATVIVAPITIAWRSQQEFAATTLHLGGWGWLFPLAVESGAWVCAFEAHRRVRAMLPVGSLVLWMWVLACVAAAIQLLHGTTDYGTVAGVCLAAMSLLGVVLHHVRQSADHAAAQGMTGAQRRQALWRRVRYPRLSWAASSIRAARPEVTVEQAWRAAWLDRFGVGPDSSRRDRQVARVIVRHQRRADRTAAREGALTILGGVILPVTVPTLDTPPAPPALAPSPSVTGVTEATRAQASRVAEADLPEAVEIAPAGADTPIVQAQPAPVLSKRAAELLPQVLAAVTAGELPAVPSGSAIRAHLRCGSEYAREIREYLSARHDSEVTR